MTQPWVYYFSDPPPPGCDDLKALLGGKGAGLKEMIRAGLNVPPGFTLSTDCCRRYFELSRTWPEGLEDEVRRDLARLEADTGRTFGRGARPLLVSVRSGAARSMPGMMDTLLNCGLHPALADEVGETPEFWHVYAQFVLSFAATVNGLDDKAFARAGVDTAAAGDRAAVEALLEAYRCLAGGAFPTEPWDVLAACIGAVFDSWLNDRAVAYRKRHGIRGLAGTAVNVQAMFPSEVSGIVFTRDPTEPAGGRMVVEASYGLGESVVSGDVTPDRFLVAREDFSAADAEIGHKAGAVRALGVRRDADPDAPCLTGEQIAELCALARRVEEHFGHPVDMEWGLADGRFSLLQARAIRGLEVAREVAAARQAEIDRLREGGDERRHVWVMHNLAETLRFPTPLTWDVVRRFMSGEGGFGRMYQRLGYRPSARVRDEGFLELICGRIYADPDRLAELFWDGMPLCYDLDALLAEADRSGLNEAPSRFDPNRADGRFLRKLPGNLWAMIRTARRTKRYGREVRRRLEQDALPPYLDYVRAKRRQDLSQLADEQVIEELRSRCGRVLDEFGCESLLPGFFGGLALARLEAMLSRLMGPQAAAELAGTLTRALPGDTTFEQDALLHRVATGQATMQEFLDRFGHRCIGEMELAEPRWREDPTYLWQMAERMRSGGRDPERMHRQTRDHRLAAEAELGETLRRWGGSSFRERIEQDLAEAQALLPYRETGKHYLMMGYELLRLAVEALARRWDLGGDVYFLTVDELASFAGDRSRLDETVAARRVRWQAFQRLRPADAIDSNDLDSLGLAPPVEAAAELKGTCIAPGAATGEVRVVLDPREAGELGTDYVLTCPSTDPGWTPLFVHAAALVVERGGVLSHGAIVARDFGIPAVVLPDATRLLADGDRVRVDGGDGRVLVIGKDGGRA